MMSMPSTNTPPRAGLGWGRSEAFAVAGLYLVGLITSAVLAGHTLTAFVILVPGVLLYALGEAILKRRDDRAAILGLTALALTAGVLAGLLALS